MPAVEVFGITVDFFLFVYLALAGAMFVIRSTYLLLTGLGKRTVNQPLDLILFALTTAFMFLVPAGYALWDPAPFLDYNVPAALSWMGVIVLIAAGLIIWRAHADLGSNFAIAPGWKGGHALVTKGVYSRVRHPMYLGLLLWSMAMPLMVTNLAVGLPMLPTVVAFCVNRIPLEERLLVEQFGDRYRQYMKRTGRLLPPLRRS